MVMSKSVPARESFCFASCSVTTAGLVSFFKLNLARNWLRPARAEIDAAALQAQAAVNGSDQKIAAAVKDYDAALGALRDKIDQKKRSGG